MEQTPSSEQSSHGKTLIELAKRDQEARLTHSEKIKDIDLENQKELARIVQERGWPTRSRDGSDVADAAWLIVQHADNDPGFQQQCFELMKDLPESEVSQEQMAYLIDRIRVNAGEPQLFGTQFNPTETTTEPYPIEDPENLDERRKQVGLPPFEEYAQQMQALQKKWSEENKNKET